jgi:hypothetical protein
MADALTEYRGFLNKLLGNTDGLEVSALEQEVAHRLGLMFAGGTDTAGTPTISVPFGPLSDSLNVSGRLTASDSSVLSGRVEISGQVRTVEAVKTVSDTLLATESGSLIRVQGDTAGLTLTLPATAAGLDYLSARASQGNTAADIVIKPAAVDAFIHDTFGTPPATDKDGILSDANDTGAGVGGELVHVVADGATGWYITELRGVFKNSTDP